MTRSEESMTRMTSLTDSSGHLYPTPFQIYACKKDSHLCKSFPFISSFLSGRVARDRRRTSFEGAKGRAKDSETATQRRDRKLLIKGEDLQRCESFLHT